MFKHVTSTNAGLICAMAIFAPSNTAWMVLVFGFLFLCIIAALELFIQENK